MSELIAVMVLVFAVGSLINIVTLEGEQDRVLKECALHHTTKLAKGVAIDCTVTAAP